MAKVAVFFEPPPSTSNLTTQLGYHLLQSLQQAHHEILLFTNNDPNGFQNFNLSNKIQIVHPFKKWSMIEVGKALPTLTFFQPDILYFIQPFFPSGYKWSHVNRALCLSKSIFRAACAVSFLDLDRTVINKPGFKEFVGSAEMITVSNYAQKSLLQASLLDKKDISVEVLPLPLLNTKSSLPSWVSEGFKRFVYVPGPHQPDELEPLLIASSRVLRQSPEFGIVFAGGVGDLNLPTKRKLQRLIHRLGLSARVAMPSHLSAEQQHELLQLGDVVFAASLAPESLQSTHCLRQAIKANKPIIVNAHQAKADSFEWIHKQNSLIVSGSDIAELETTLNLLLGEASLSQQISSHLAGTPTTRLSDDTGNLLNRGFVRAQTKARLRRN